MGTACCPFSSEGTRLLMGVLISPMSSHGGSPLAQRADTQQGSDSLPLAGGDQRISTDQLDWEWSRSWP
ncbi:uncharacterized protein PGTG_21356 [Puccinia graminis f. sp. tritici CRL 75-36-700-3]|uniref:Uncharacterized protein n=1 Tax=Puccinia graminis f. sp. tritici (strain CRL 75-36-700-3 / race SCCL) TaxID=418459 RepID=H6QRD9_PUCGT|nr:uncharacterized protein PGTG_21356 [Puccinia graminis f. sp. tritici CRL 75-36-700-3]EHS63205.1 hypothetical protein PGTG_21356 [Puccinia graminis f. sp. tritici CRL 75-36-700-3]